MGLCHLGCGRGMGQRKGSVEMRDVGCWLFGRERRIDGNDNRESKRVCGTKRER